MQAKFRISVDVVFRALADRTRLRILNLLGQGELCVCDIVCVLDVLQPTASRHLAYLRKAGLVIARKQGLWHYYRLSPATSLFHQRLLQCVAACATELPDLKQDAAHLKACGRSNCSD